MTSVFCTLSHVTKCCPACFPVLASSWPWVGHRGEWFPQGLTGKTYMQCSEHMALIRPVTSVQHALTNFALASTWKANAKLRVTCKKKKKPNLENSSAELHFASHEAEDSSQTLRLRSHSCVFRCLSCHVSGRKIKLKDELKSRVVFLSV